MRKKRVKIISIFVFILFVLCFYAFSLEKSPSIDNNKVQKKQREHKPSKSILIASSTGDVNQVRLLISEGADIESKNQRRETPMVLAAKNGHIEVVKLLLDKGANIDGSKAGHSNNDFTPLQIAIKNDNSELVKLLLARGANPGLYCPYGSSLDITVEKNNREMTELLIKNKVDINIKNQSEETPIFRAIMKNNKDFVEYLISNGAEINVKGRSIKTPLHSAALLKDPEIAELLISKGADINAVYDKGNTVIDDAINDFFFNHKKIVSLLVSKNVSVSTAEKIHLFSYLGNLSEVQNLINQGVDVNLAGRYGFSPLHFAVAGENTHVVKYLIEKGAKINAKDKINCTPLHLAALRDNKEISQLLISNGADFNIRIDTTKVFDRILTRIENETPLYLAVMYGYKNAAEILIEKGAVVKERNGNGFDTMMLAVRYNQKDIVKMLIEKGADVNAARGTDRWSPLHSAVSQGYKDIVELLIANGANINAKDSEGKTPLYCAIYTNNCSKELVEFLISKGADVNAKTKDGLTPLCAAARYNYRDIAELLIAKGADINSGKTSPLFGAQQDVIELLLDKGVDVNARNREGETALHIAAEYGNVEAVETFIQNGADVNAVTTVSSLPSLLRRNQQQPETPLYQAIAGEHQDVVQLLIAYGAKKDSDSEKLLQNEMNPLLRAVEKDNLEEAKSLLSKGADIKFKDKRDWTLLHHAAKRPDKNMIELLLDKGADVNAVTKDGMSVLDYAVTSRNKDIVDLMLARGAAVTSIYAAAFIGDKDKVNDFIKKGTSVNAMMVWQGSFPLHFAANKDIAELLIANGAVVNVTDYKQRTPLHYAAEKADEGMVKLFLDKGGSINVKDSENYTPLIFAICNNNKDIIKLLIDKGADVNLGDQGGMSPLCTSVVLNDKEIVELLISKGANVNKKDADGRTPLAWARDFDKAEIVELLLKHGAKE